MKAVFLVGTLKKKEEAWSHTQALCEVVAEVLKQEQQTESEIIYLRDYRIEPGTKTNIDNDDWPGIVEKMLKADIVVFATPVWWGIQSSLLQRAIERLDELNDELIETGKSEFANKVGGVVITGGEDGAQHIIGNVLNFLSWNGFTIPPAPSVSYLGSVKAKTKDEFKEFLRKDSTFAMAQTFGRNAAHLARVLKQNPLPSKQN